MKPISVEGSKGTTNADAQAGGAMFPPLSSVSSNKSKDKNRNKPRGRSSLSKLNWKRKLRFKVKRFLTRRNFL